MNENQKQAIKNFFKSTKILKELNVIRSSTYTGDIAEFVCAEKLNITLSESQRQSGLDGTDSTGREVQIKYHGGEVRNNIIMTSYSKGDFDDLVVVLAPNSSIRPEFCACNTFSIFKIEDYFDKNIGNIAKTVLKNQSKLIIELNEYMENI